MSVTAWMKQKMPWHSISDIAEARKCLLKGNELDLAKAEKLLLDDFRSCRLGKITLEFPENEEAGEDE